jgi:transposase
MPNPAKPPLHFIGCDVGKAAIVVFDSRDTRAPSIPNQPDALAAFAKSLDPSCFVVCEATGGHETALLAAMVSAGVPVHRADARKVKAFIRSYGTLGKTDAIDARALARYGAERHPGLARWQPCDAWRGQLQDLVLTRNDLVATRVAYANRLDAPGTKAGTPFIEAVLAALDAQILAIDAATTALIRDNTPLRQAVKTLTSITSIGVVTATSLLALMPELGHLDRRQAAALGGLAPHPNQSGASDGYRRTKGGRPEVRKALFMAALSAARHHKTLRPFYEKLIANGKKKLVALAAVMRKLLIICNAVLRPDCRLAPGTQNATGH